MTPPSSAPVDPSSSTPDGGETTKDLATLFVRLPRLTLLVVGLALVAGLAALDAMPRQEDPTLTSRFATIETAFPGAAPDRVEALVTEPMEQALADIAEIHEIQSTSRTGYSVLSLELGDAVTEVEPVWSRVRDRMADVATRLPDGARPPVFNRQYAEAHALIVGLSWVAPAAGARAAPAPDAAGGDDASAPIAWRGDPGLLARLAKDLKARLERVPGARTVDLYGLPEEEITVAVDPRALAVLGLTPDGIATSLAAADAKAPAGSLVGSGGAVIVEVAGALESAERVRAIPLRRDAAGGLLRVGDVATVGRGVRSPPASLALINDRPAVLVAVRMEPGWRVDRWARTAADVVHTFGAEVPSGLAVEILFDQSHFTAQRLDGLLRNLLMGVGLVMVVLWAMMGWRSALVVGAALPLTLTTVVFCLSALGVPLHQISVTGLVIALGLLIDNAIVAVDAFQRARAAGVPPRPAVRGLVRHLAVPLLASTLTTVLTFAPLVLMPGPTGEFVGAMAVAVILSIVVSLGYALTVVPAVAVWLEERGSARPASRGVVLPRVAALYRRGLEALLARPLRAMGLAMAPAVVGFALLPTLPGQFFPPADRAQFQVQITVPGGSSLAETRAAVARARAVLAAWPGIGRSVWVIGANPPKVYYNAITKGEADPTFAGGFVETASPEETRALLPDLQRALMVALPEAEVLAIPFEQGPPFDAPLEVELIGPDIDTLRRLGETVRGLLAATPGVTYTRMGLAGGYPVFTLDLDEDEVRAAGYGLDDVARALAARQEGVTGGSVLEGTETLPVRVRTREAERGQVASLGATPLVAMGAAADGAPPALAPTGGVPLTALGDLHLVPRVAAIPRLDGERRNRIQGFLMPYTLPSAALADFRARLAAAGLVLPTGYRLEYGGEARESGESQAKLAASLAPLLVLLFGVLILALNSLRQALMLGAVAGLALGMAFLAVGLCQFPFGFMALVGGMGLIGLALNDSIVILSALRACPRARTGDVAAVRAVVEDGSRHVVSTTVTTVGGFLPLIVSGDPFWVPLATAVAGGVVGATGLALVFVPAAWRLLVARPARRRA